MILITVSIMGAAYGMAMQIKFQLQATAYPTCLGDTC